MLIDFVLDRWEGKLNDSLSTTNRPFPPIHKLELNISMEHVLQLLVRDLVFWDCDLENSRLVELPTYNGEALVLVLDDSSTFACDIYAC